MKSHVLHTVLCYISGEAAGGNLKLITLGSEKRQNDGRARKNRIWLSGWKQLRYSEVFWNVFLFGTFRGAVNICLCIVHVIDCSLHECSRGQSRNLRWTRIPELCIPQYEEINSMGMLLTDTQRKWVTILKEAAKKKPPAKGLKPKVRHDAVHAQSP